MKLLHNKVLITPEDPNITESGLFLGVPNPTEKARPFQGTVEYVGHKVTNVSVGDRVHFPAMMGKDFPYEGVTYITIRDEDIHGIFEQN
jgi:co-chaperonin GroES (HSP10)